MALPATACAQAPAPAAGRAADVITEAVIRGHVNVIAADSMLGRDTPSRGLDMTASYIAATFRALGLQPGGDSGSYIQRYPVATGAKTSGPRAAAGGEASFDPHSAPNVVGILPGTDATLRHQYVVISAHMDHVGVSPGSTPDSIWNGADDDASGTAGVLALAAALAQDPPRRSVILLTVSGEEKGLWGSRWFTENPPVPVDSIVADLNLDMIGRNWKDTISVIGLPYSDLGTTLKQVVAAHPELGLTAVGDLWPQENFFVRSDHYNFVRQGIPALFFFNGTHEDYHRASDSPDRIDAEKEARVVRLVYHTVIAVGNADARPAWDPASKRRLVPRQ